MKDEKTEKATPKKLKDSRKEGQVARSQELGGWAALLALAVNLDWLVVRGIDYIQALTVGVLAAIQQPTAADAIRMLHEGAVRALVLSVVIGLVVLLVGVASGSAQGGLHLATKVLKPKWSRLNPVEGAKRVFGPHALWEGAKLLLKSTVVAVFVWQAVEQMMPLLGGLVPVNTALELAGAEIETMMRNIAAAGLVAAAVDYLVQRRRTGKQVRMTKKEVRDEHRQSEGDPLVRSALRSRQLAAARSRMMSDVPKADVVLVNPTHVAVALEYQAARGAPRVVAKGAGAIAARIRVVAEESRVPLVEDVPLARALHASCQVGQEIPAELYHAVAQVLAFVLSRRADGATAGHHRSPREDLAVPEVRRTRGRRLLAGAAGESSGSRPAGR